MNFARAAGGVCMGLCLAASAPVLAGGHAHGGGFHGGARAHGGGAHAGIYIGAPVVRPYYRYAPPAYYTPYSYYYPPVVVARPPVYAGGYYSQPAPAVWYYCASAGAYYPYVSVCPEGWQHVVPTPPA